MPTPFPGMDPYLEHPALWPGVHNRLIAALADDLGERIAPRYYIGLEERTLLLAPGDLVSVGRPDLAVLGLATGTRPEAHWKPAGAAVLEVDVPMLDEVRDTFLEIHQVDTGQLVTVVEILSPVNKQSKQGRKFYERKRRHVLETLTNFVEIDLLRAGEPMPLMGQPVASDYRILVSRGEQRPRSQLYPFTVRQAIPPFPMPLLPGDDEPMVHLGGILYSLYNRARFDLRLNYDQPAVPPLAEADVEWARGLRRTG